LDSGLDRRSFLRRGFLGVAGATLLGSPLLAACGDDSDASTTTTGGGGGGADLGTLDFQLSWIKNVEFAGEYLADSKGYYRDEGFSKVNLLAGGPNVQQDAVVASGKAFIGTSFTDIAASAIVNGAPIIAIAAQYQKNPFCVMSLAESPISSPEDLIGKKVGVQAVNEPVWNAFLTANDIDPGSITKVPAQFDPQPLINGEVDGWMSFVTNEPNLLKVKGIDTEVLLLNDHGYPMVTQVYIVQTKSLTEDRDKIKAVLRAEIKGWHDSFADPAAAPALVVSTYGKDLGLDEAEQTLESAAQNQLILTDDTKGNGIFTVTDQMVADTMSTLELAGVTIEQDKLFDFSVIKEVYEENPELKTSPNLA
jgi:ABC-type nitrate/sulfonate/bicarbonate transport system substrate-binding protein